MSMHGLTPMLLTPRTHCCALDPDVSSDNVNKQTQLLANPNGGKLQTVPSPKRCTVLIGAALNAKTSNLCKTRNAETSNGTALNAKTRLVAARTGLCMKATLCRTQAPCSMVCSVRSTAVAAAEVSSHKSPHHQMAPQQGCISLMDVECTVHNCIDLRTWTRSSAAVFFRQTWHDTARIPV